MKKQTQAEILRQKSDLLEHHSTRDPKEFLAMLETLKSVKKQAPYQHNALFISRYKRSVIFYTFGFDAVVVMKILSVDPSLIRLAEDQQRNHPEQPFACAIHVGQLAEICKELTGLGYWPQIIEEDDEKVNVWGPPNMAEKEIETAIGPFILNQN